VEKGPHACLDLISDAEMDEDVREILKMLAALREMPLANPRMVTLIS